MTSYALPRRRGLFARLIGEADDFATWLIFGSETWLIAAMKAVPMFLFIYWLFTYVPNSVYYGITQYIPFLQLSAEVGFIVANGVAWTNVVLVVILGIAWLMSSARRSIRWRTVAWGIGLQVVFAVIVLRTAPGRWLFEGARSAVTRLLSFTDQGAGFLFGNLYRGTEDISQGMGGAGIDVLGAQPLERAGVAGEVGRNVQHRDGARDQFRSGVGRPGDGR